MYRKPTRSVGFCKCKQRLLSTSNCICFGAYFFFFLKFRIAALAQKTHIFSVSIEG